MFIWHATIFLTYAEETEDKLEGMTIKEIRIIGAKWTREYVITREMLSKVGQPYSALKVQKDYQHLDRLGIFSEIEIRPIENEGEVILEVTVKESLPFFPSPALRITDEDGLQLGFSIGYINALHKGVSGSITALFGGATNIELKIKDPWLFGNHLGYDFQFYHRDRKNEVFEYKEKANEIYFAWSSYIKENGRAGVRFAFQAIQSDTIGRTLSPDNKDQVPYLGFYIGYDSRDLWSNPKRGWWNELEVLRSGLFGGDSDFWRVTLDIRRFIAFHDRHIFVLNILGTYTSGDIGKDVAIWQQFAIGGTNSIRGWDLGSRTGKNQNINTLEYRYNIIPPHSLNIFGRFDTYAGLQFAVFGDFGHAWNFEEEFKLENYIGGYGAGIRLLLPGINMVRFDFGWGQDGTKMIFQLGVNEKAVIQRFRVR
jgi:outer membrane protein insertion porin family